MGVHDTAPGGDAVIEHELHDTELVYALGKPNTVALPIAARPSWLCREENTRKLCQLFRLVTGNLPAGLQNLRQSLELFAPYSGLQVGHPVIEANFRVSLEDHLGGLI